MAKGFGYVTIRMNFDYPDGQNVDEAFQTVVSEMDYSLRHDEEGVKLTGTEILDAEGAEVEVEEEETTTCKFCRKETPVKTAHLHQGEYVGECCWDERLRVTE